MYLLMLRIDLIPNSLKPSLKGIKYYLSTYLPETYDANNMLRRK